MSYLKLIPIGLVVFALTGCYNAAMMRATGESRATCQSDSDCPEDFMCVFNISPNSALGECVSQNSYDPWANRRLEDFIKLKEKNKELNKDVPEAENPDSRWFTPPDKEKK
jgi:hypothetical protein